MLEIKVLTRVGASGSFQRNLSHTALPASGAHWRFCAFLGFCCLTPTSTFIFAQHSPCMCGQMSLLCISTRPIGVGATCGLTRTKYTCVTLLPRRHILQYLGL